MLFKPRKKTCVGRKRGAARTPRAFYDRLPTYDLHETERMTEAMHTDGFVLIPNVVTEDEIAAARERIDQLETIHWDFTGPIDHYKNVFNRDPFWLRFLDKPGIIELAEAVLGADCHIIGETAWRSHPGHEGVGVHLDYLPVDWGEAGVPAGFRMPAFLATAHYYLSDITKKLCPTHVIPGSHRAGRRPGPLEMHWEGRAAQAVLCRAGDVLFFRSDLWHSGSDNVTAGQTRYLLQVHYGRREMAQHFSPFLTWQFNPAIVGVCNERQRRLLGDHKQGAYD